MKRKFAKQELSNIEMYRKQTLILTDSGLQDIQIWPNICYLTRFLGIKYKLLNRIISISVKDRLKLSKIVKTLPNKIKRKNGICKEDARFIYFYNKVVHN